MKKFKSDPNCEVNSIRQHGTITDESKDSYYVKISVQSACSSCHANNLCHLTEVRDKIIEVAKNEDSLHKTGDEVEIMMEKSLGTKAVVLGYLLPFALLIISLLIVKQFIKSDGLAGLISIGVLVPYYLVLYAFRKLIGNTFVFRIR